MAHKPGQPMKIPRGRLRHGQERLLAGKDDGKGEKHRHGWRDEPDQTYEAPAGKYLQHVYGEKEYGGTQVSFKKVAESVKKASPDVVGLEEAETNTARLARLAGYKCTAIS